MGFPGAGTEQDPIRCSPTTDEYLSKAVEASWKGTHGGLPISSTDRAYWMDKAGHKEEYSDLIWRQGWNRYWETRMRPDNQGSADPKLGDLPAQYQPDGVIPVPPEPIPPSDIDVKLDKIIVTQLLIIENLNNITSQMNENQNEIMVVLNQLMNAINSINVVFPPYTGKLGMSMTFNPQK